MEIRGQGKKKLGSLKEPLVEVNPSSSERMKAAQKTLEEKEMERKSVRHYSCAWQSS